MLPPYCCWLVGVCAVPGKGAPVRCQVAWPGCGPGRLSNPRAIPPPSSKPYGVNHNIRKLRLAQDLAELIFAPAIAVLRQRQ